MNEFEVQTIRVRVTSGGKRETIEVAGNDTLIITVREPAARNEANHRVRELIARHFAVPLRAVRIVAGHRSPTKRLEIKTTAS